MGFRLESIVPWGRSFDEYVAMFALSEADLKRRILGCGDGPAAFNAVLTERGGRIVSVDPLYGVPVDAIRRRIAETYPEVMAQARRNRDEFVWDRIGTVEALGCLRMAAMETFLADYPAGLRQGRYLPAALPTLPFTDGAFELAVCSHLLFLYSEVLSEAFHLASLRELCRVAGEVRVFPLLELGTRPSRHLKAVSTRLIDEGYGVSVEPVAYEFQRGGNRMLRVLKGNRGA